MSRRTMVGPTHTAPPPLPPHLFALGIISAPERAAQRALLRETWLTRMPRSGSGRFVVRAGHSGSSAAPAALVAECSRHKRDMLCLKDVKWSASRISGPVLSLLAWLRVAGSWPVKFVLKADEDVYADLPQVALLLRQSLRARPYEDIMLGVLTWTSWLADDFSICGWSFFPSRPRDLYGKPCPMRQFPFFSGYFGGVSRSLAARLATSANMSHEVAAVKKLELMYQNSCGVGTACGVLEDAWLGSAIARFASNPNRALFRLSIDNFVTDEVARRRSRCSTPTSSLIVHTKSSDKIREAEENAATQPERKWALHCEHETACSVVLREDTYCFYARRRMAGARPASPSQPCMASVPMCNATHFIPHKARPGWARCSLATWPPNPPACVYVDGQGWTMPSSAASRVLTPQAHVSPSRGGVLK